MSDIHLPSAPNSDDDGDQPEVRLELTRAGVEQVLSLYSQEKGTDRSDSGFSLSFEDFERAFRERRQLLVRGIVAGLVLGGLVLLFSTPLYPVSTHVVLERHDVTDTSISGGAMNAGSAFIATQAQVLQSHSVIADAVAGIPRAIHLDADDDAVQDALSSIVASPITGSQVVALGYLGPDAEHGVRLVTAIVESYRKVLSRGEAKSQNQRLIAKQAEVDVLVAESREIEERIEALRLEHNIIGSVQDAAAIQTEIVRDQGNQLSEVRNERITLEKRLAAGDDQLSILDPATRSLQERLWEAEAELARVRLTLTDQHPAVEAAQHQVNGLKRQLRASSQATPEALRRDIDAALGLEEALEIAYADAQQQLANIESHRRDENMLLLELQRVRDMTDARRAELLDQRLAARLAEAGEAGITARIIEAPVLPDGAAWPRPKFVLAAGALLGLLGGLVAAIVSLRRSNAWRPRPTGPTAAVQ